MPPVVSIVLLYPIFVHDTLGLGNAFSGCAFSLIGISPPRGSLRAALLCCDGFITLDFRTERKYHYCLCLSWPSLRIAPHRQSLNDSRQHFFFHHFCLCLCVRSCSLPVYRQQRECKKCAVLFNFQRAMKG